MSATPPDWQDLIGDIYDAAMDDALWTPAIRRIMQQVGASQSILFSPIVDIEASQPYILNRDFSDDYWDLYKAYYWQHDVWTPRAIEADHLDNTAIVQGDRLIHRAEFRRTEYFQDYLRLLDIEVLLGATLIDGSTPQSAPRTQLGLFRPPGAESFSRQDEQFLHHLLPHLQRSLHIRWQLSKCRETRTLREAALDHIAQAVALLDERGCVLFANRRAEAIFRDGGGPTVVNRRLTAAGAEGTSRLKEALRRAALGVGSSVRLENPARRRRWVATFSPLRIPGQAFTQGARILVLIAEPDQPPAGALPQFAQLYSLTPAETRVLEQLLQQESTQGIAETLAISIKTLRIHLSNLFAKTATANQRELVRFFLAHPAIIPPANLYAE